jgi:superfamily II DNA or RNA helicase
VERIIDRAVTEGRSWLVLAASLTILDRLHTYALNLGLAAEFVCGATKKSERTAALARMKNGQARILFATYQLAKEGLDIPCLDRLVLATPTRNKVIVQQSIGRIQRSAPGKTEALVIDLVDEKTPQLMVQYKQRRTLYKNMNITEKE